MALETATFAEGCFWGVEVTFRNVPGVKDAAVGYMGGTMDNPTYRDVCTDRTGHAEVVQVDFDPAEVSYARLLDVFWGSHDPTQLNRQGPDVGGQYRTAIFYHTPEQKSRSRGLQAARGCNPVGSAARSSPKSLPQARSGAARSTISSTLPSEAWRPATSKHRVQKSGA